MVGPSFEYFQAQIKSLISVRAYFLSHVSDAAEFPREYQLTQSSGGYRLSSRKSLEERLKKGVPLDLDGPSGLARSQARSRPQAIFSHTIVFENTVSPIRMALVSLLDLSLIDTPAS